MIPQQLALEARIDLDNLQQETIRPLHSLRDDELRAVTPEAEPAAAPRSGAPIEDRPVEELCVSEQSEGRAPLLVDDESRPVIVSPPFARPRRPPSPDKRRAFPS
jgi:hypothetical protein